MPLPLGVLRRARYRPPVFLQPRARRARLRDGGVDRGASWPPVGDDGCGNGRRQLRHVRGRARDRGAPQAADHLPRDCERHLRLDQGGPESRVRPALLLGRLRRHRPRQGCRRFRYEELARDRSARIGLGAENRARARRSNARGYRLPAAARSESAGVRVGGMIERGHHDMGGLPAGKVEPTEHDYADWERRVDAMAVLMAAKGITGDEGRKHIEMIPPAAYDKMADYERWIVALPEAVNQRRLDTNDELARQKNEVQR